MNVQVILCMVALFVSLYLCLLFIYCSTVLCLHTPRFVNYYCRKDLFGALVTQFESNRFLLNAFSCDCIRSINASLLLGSVHTRYKTSGNSSKIKTQARCVFIFCMENCSGRNQDLREKITQNRVINFQ